MDTPIPRPLAAEHPEMAPGRANPAAPASSQPGVRQPAGSMNNTATPAMPPVTGGVLQPGLPPTQDTAKTAQALTRAEIHSLLYKFGMVSMAATKRAEAMKRAEVLSLFYKHGVAPKAKSKPKEKSPSKEFKSTVGRDAAVGSVLGGVGGAALGAHTVQYTPPVSLSKEVLAAGRKPGLENMRVWVNAAKTQQTIPTKFVPRLQGAIKTLGLKNVLAAAAKIGLVGAGVGAIGGLGLGLAEHGLRKRSE